MTRKQGAVALLMALIALTVGAIVAAGGERASSSAQKKPARYTVRDLYIETNATDGDAGLQLKVDADPEWRWLKLRDPRGRLLVAVRAGPRLRRYGLTELFFEAAEPSFDEHPFSRFKRRFPEGRYSFRGRGVEGRRLASSDRFTHTVPRRPEVTFPTSGARVSPDGFTITWNPVTRPAGVDIVRYIVLVTQGSRVLSMDMPGSATSASVPGEFLRPGTETEVEVLSREKSGNQTITAVEFRTQ